VENLRAILSARLLGGVFISLLFPFIGEAGNLKNCFEPKEATRTEPAKECRVEGLNEKLVYPQKSKDGQSIAGCYDQNLRRVKDIPGGEVDGRCDTGDAPIRYYLRYRTTCPEGKTSCTYGSQVLVIPEMSMDGPHPFGAAFNPGLNFGLPIKISKSNAGYSAAESCEFLQKQDPGYVWDPIAQTCLKAPSVLCKEIGFYWSVADQKCISQHQEAVHAESDRCSNDECAAADPVKYCSGHPFQPVGKNCFCLGSSVSKLDRNPTDADPLRKGACEWLHYDIQMNPVCNAWNEPLTYVPDSTDPNKDRCCKGSSCPGFTEAGASLTTTPKSVGGYSGPAYRNFIQIGPADRYPTQSPGKGISPGQLKP
jgi:hypothetical protein